MNMHIMHSARDISYRNIYHIISLWEFALFLNHSPISGKHTVIIMICKHKILSLVSIESSINSSQGSHGLLRQSNNI